LAWLLPLDENIFFHRQVAYSMLFFTVVHVSLLPCFVSFSCR
jgi:NADPH oxidase